MGTKNVIRCNYHPFRSGLGGARRDRTADLLHAMQALSQLSYSPTEAGTLCSQPETVKPGFTGPDSYVARKDLVRRTSKASIGACRGPGFDQFDSSVEPGNRTIPAD